MQTIRDSLMYTGKPNRTFLWRTGKQASQKLGGPLKFNLSQWMHRLMYRNCDKFMHFSSFLYTKKSSWCTTHYYSYYGKQIIESYVPWCSLKYQYKESCSFLCQLFVQIFKPVAHKCHILTCLFTVTPSERRDSRQQDIHYNTNTPNVSLWESWFIVQHFWSCKNVT
jgi:hypothetical protein